MTANAFGSPSASGRVPSMGSTAMSTACTGVCSIDAARAWLAVRAEEIPINSPLYSIGALSFSPSPMTTTPSISIESSRRRIASTAAASAFSFSLRPIQRAAASAALSVTRTSSIARFRSSSAMLSLHCQYFTKTSKHPERSSAVFAERSRRGVRLTRKHAPNRRILRLRGKKRRSAHTCPGGNASARGMFS